MSTFSLSAKIFSLPALLFLCVFGSSCTPPQPANKNNKVNSSQPRVTPFTAMTPTRLAPESPTPVHTFKLAPSGQLAGLVTGVHDGDTINLLLEDRVLVKIRLKGIDAPELRQDFGSEARANLSRIILGKRVEVVYEKIDHYRRPVGTIILDGQDINVVQIDEGMAWHFKRYEYEQPDKERLHYAAAEVRARELRKGLWTLEDPMPPWIYRDRNRLGH